MSPGGMHGIVRALTVQQAREPTATEPSAGPCLLCEGKRRTSTLSLAWTLGETAVMSCSTCDEIEAIESGRRDWAIAKLAHGYVWLNPTQYYRGAIFYVANQCVAELHELEPAARAGHLHEMAAAAAAMQRAVGAAKINYEALGNSVPHLHWWLTPRHADDPRPRAPIWENLDFLRLLWTGQARLDQVDNDPLRAKIAEELRREDVEIVESYC